MGRKFTKIDEAFVCENCGKQINPLGYTCRDHCNYCLHSKHVDKNPGDRAETCHGDLEPVSLEIDGKKSESISKIDKKTCYVVIEKDKVTKAQFKKDN